MQFLTENSIKLYWEQTFPINVKHIFYLSSEQTKNILDGIMPTL